MRSSLIGDESAVTGSAGQAPASTPPLPEEENRTILRKPSPGEVSKICARWSDDYVSRNGQPPAVYVAAREGFCLGWNAAASQAKSQLSALQAENAALRAEHARRDAVDESEAEAVQKMGAEIGRLLIALHDAIRRPLGVTPDSALEFFSYRLSDEAEERRPRIGTPAEVAERPEARLSALQERVERAEKALEPFAAAIDARERRALEAAARGSWVSSDDLDTAELVLAHLRSARSALRAARNSLTPESQEKAGA